MKRILCLVLVLAGCGQTKPDSQAQAIANNFGYGWDYDQKSDVTGLRVRFDKFPQPIPISELDRMFIEVEQCVGATAHGPLLIWSDTSTFRDNGFGEPISGETFLETGTSRIDDNEQGIPTLAEHTIKHEFIHWVLWDSGLDTDRASHFAHRSPKFTECI